MTDHLPEAIALAQETLKVVVILSAPPLLVALVVGTAISVVQTATQIQEMTLSFIPKVIAVLACFFVLLPWMLQVLIDFTRTVITDMAFAFIGRG